jgi:hypothetical protein
MTIRATVITESADGSTQRTYEAELTLCNGTSAEVVDAHLVGMLRALDRQAHTLDVDDEEENADA